MQGFRMEADMMTNFKEWKGLCGVIKQWEDNGQNLLWLEQLKKEDKDIPRASRSTLRHRRAECPTPGDTHSLTVFPIQTPAVGSLAIPKHSESLSLSPGSFLEFPPEYVLFSFSLTSHLRRALFQDPSCHACLISCCLFPHYFCS